MKYIEFDNSKEFDIILLEVHIFLDLQKETLQIVYGLICCKHNRQSTVSFTSAAILSTNSSISERFNLMPFSRRMSLIF